MKSLNQDLVDESEIGLAILFGDLKDHCNPNKTENKLVEKEKLASQTLRHEDTQEPKSRNVAGAGQKIEYDFLFLVRCNLNTP